MGEFLCKNLDLTAGMHRQATGAWGGRNPFCPNLSGVGAADTDTKERIQATAPDAARFLSVRKKVKKGVDFAGQTRYNVCLYGKLEEGGAIHAQH